jgi:hypothetical protein|tara:strand:- start:34 stop:546 length:513 start_codon:yes stop_codon:yes gene_type:complete
MAVPATGTLSMQDIAQERLNSTYGSGNVSGPISMYNLVNGGNTGGAVTSGNNYPAVNTGCLPNPASRNAYVAFQNVFKEDNGTETGPFTFYLNPSEAATVSAVANGDIVYSDADLTTPLSAFGDIGSGSGDRYYFQSHSIQSEDMCNHTGVGTFDIDSNGAMQSKGCAIP